jgi:hypothetical protein
VAHGTPHAAGALPKLVLPEGSAQEAALVWLTIDCAQMP